MNRTLVAAAAALVVVIGAAAVALQPSATVGPPTSPRPTAATPPATPPGATSSADASTVPAELVRLWQGVPHDVPGSPDVRALSFGFTFDVLGVKVNYGPERFDSRARVSGPNTLELTALSDCGSGVVGTYRWSLSPGGTLLDLAAIDDPCDGRAAALAGNWHSTGCKDPSNLCWGDLEAGTYPTLFFAPRLPLSEEPRPTYGALRFTVPDGWAVASDHTSDVRLLRSSEYAKEGSGGPASQPTGIEVWIRPAANRPDAGCDVAPAEDLDPVIGPLAAWVRSHPALTTSAVHDVTIGGHPAKWLDVSLRSTWAQTCGSERTAALFTERVGEAGPVGDEPYLVGISGDARMRVIFLDLGPDGASLRDTVMILVTAPDQAAFDSFIDDAMPIIESFRFE